MQPNQTAQPVTPAAINPAPVVRESEPNDPIFTLGVVTLVMVVVAWGVLFMLGSTRTSQINESQKKITKLNTDLKVLDPTLQTYTALDSVLTQSKKVRDSRYLFGPTWETLKESVPKDVQFANLTMGNDHTFRISGTTKSVSSVAQFAKELEKKSGITMVTPLSVEKQATGSLYNFNMSFKVSTKADTTKGSAQ